MERFSKGNLSKKVVVKLQMGKKMVNYLETEL